MRRLRLSLAISFLLPLLLAWAPAARAGELGWSDIVRNAPSWQRPTLDLTGTVPGPPVLVHAISFFVDVSGVYTITSAPPSAIPRAIYLYAGSFDPSRPLANLIGAADAGPTGEGTATITLQLAAGVIYRVATSPLDLNLFQSFLSGAVSGPGQPRFSACFADFIHLHDDDQDLRLAGGRFCVAATWRDGAGRTGIGLPVGHRSGDSGLFYFFNPENWELSVKVLDGCAVNGHFWVFLSGSTDVAFTVTVQDLLIENGSPPRTYTNPLGHPASAVTDTSAFDCTP